MIDLYPEEEIRDGATFEEVLGVAHRLQEEVKKLRRACENNMEGWMQHAAGLQRQIQALENQNLVLKDVLEDMEMRFSCVLDLATGGRMSKTNYTKAAMEAEIIDNLSRCERQAIEEDREERKIV